MLYHQQAKKAENGQIRNMLSSHLISHKRSIINLHKRNESSQDFCEPPESQEKEVVQPIEEEDK